MSKNDLDHWLSRFMLEVRRKVGKEFPPKSLHHICCGILQHLRECGNSSLDVFKDHELANFRQTVDSELKRLLASGLGSSKHKQVEPIDEEEENIL